MSDASFDQLLWALLGYGVFPLWLACGLLDYRFHRTTWIAETSGSRESALHLAQTAQIAIPALALLFLRVNAATLLLMILGAAAHTVTAFVDLRYAARHRHIPPLEQFVHAFLIGLPLFALAIVVVLHWPQFMALLKPGLAPADAWRLAWRTPPFETRAIVLVLLASLAFAVLPGLLEYAHTLRARRPAEPGP